MTTKTNSFSDKNMSEQIVDNSLVSQFNEYMKLYKYEDSGRARAKQNLFVEGNIASIPDGLEAVRHQVVFILDVTGSMQPYITGTKEQIHKFIGSLKNDAQKEVDKHFADKKDKISFVFEVAVVAYRDFNDMTHFETLDFTTDLDQVAKFLDSVPAEGGDDAPEDVEGALIHALFGIDDKSKKLSWDKRGPVASRILMWLADSPPHGSEINGIRLGDYFADASMKEWEHIFTELANLKLEFISARLTEHNDHTHKVFKSMCQAKNVKFDIVDISQTVNISAHSFKSDEAYFSLSSTAARAVRRGTTEYMSTL